MTITLRQSMHLMLSVSLAVALAACGSTSTGDSGTNPNNPPTNGGGTGGGGTGGGGTGGGGTGGGGTGGGGTGGGGTTPINTGNDIVVLNMDNQKGDVYSSRLVFNLHQNPAWGGVTLEMHDTAEVQIQNTSKESVQITGAVFSKPSVWT